MVATTMRPLSIGTRVLALIAFLLLSYYLGQPIYWEVKSRIVQGSGRSIQIDPVATGGEQIEPRIVTDSDTVLKNGRTAADSQAADETQADSGDVDPGESKSDSQSKTKDPNKFTSHEVLQRPIWQAPAKDTDMPPIKAFSLSKEMIKFRARKNVIIVTFANHAFQDFVLTWVRHLTNFGVSNLLVGAMDRNLTESLFWKGVPVFDMGSGMNPADAGWGTPVFHKMGREKVYLINAILGLGYEVLFCDTDMVWIKNPLPYVERYPDADVLVSSDAVVATVENDSLENWKKSYSALNIGIFHWRPTDASKRFAAEWKVLLEDDSIWDQNGFNELIQKGERLPVDPKNDTGLFFAYDRTFKVGILPVSIFCSGHTFFVQGLHKQLGLEAYAVHATYQFAGTEGKRHRFREAELFYDEPEYYSPPVGFLTFDASIPNKLLKGGNSTVEAHFALVNYQLKQVRNALAVASVLNRILVMPPIWCRFDRLWFGHPGILPDTKTPQPFLCPMDHVFEVSNMLKELDEEVFGPMIGFREYSFLDNPRVPKEVQTSRLKVEPCQGDCKASPSNGIVQIPSNSTDEQLVSHLLKHKDVRILDFTSMHSVFGGFKDEETNRRFRRRVSRYVGIWCCLEKLQRGHIFYDMFWDEKPNWKPVPPARPEDDHPPLE